jgi:hypothetical protein
LLLKRVALTDGRNHDFQLSSRRFACFADVDRLLQRQIPYLQQLVSSRVVPNSDDNAVSDHRFLDTSKLARTSHPTNIAKENVKTLTVLLYPPVKRIPFVGDVHHADAKRFKLLNNLINLFPIRRRRKLERSKDIIRIGANRCQKYGCLPFRTRITKFSGQ